MLPRSTAQDQYQLNALFFNAAKQLEESSELTFLNPGQWLCNTECQVLTEGQPIYRDAHHLSVAGALSLQKQLANGLGSQ